MGLFLVIVAGALNGSYALPMKKTGKWAFENVWLVYSVMAMGVVNWAIALVSVPQPLLVYQQSGSLAVAMVLAFGAVWGMANVFFGLGIHWVGISLTFPIAIGLSTALGSLIPLAMTPAVLLTPAGAATTVGVAVIVAGVALCGWAGVERDARLGAALQSDSPTQVFEVARSRIRENSGDFAGRDDRHTLRILTNSATPRSECATSKTQVTQGRRRLVAGLVVVALSGLTDPFLNFAFNFGQRIKEAALAHGASAGAESDAIWALALTGSLVVNGVYCCVLLTRNRSWRRFREQGTRHYWPLAALMGLVWMSSITLYGRGAAAMGPLGGSVGWAVFYGCIIVASTLWGIVCGEWRAGHGRPMRRLAGGLALLLLAIVILGYGNSLAAER